MRCRALFSLLLISIFAFSACSRLPKLSDYEGENIAINKNIRQVDLMPDNPRNYKFTDYGEIALGLDALLFDFAKNPNYVVTDQTTWLPIGYWVTSVKNKYYNGRGFGIASYVGHVANGMGSIALPSGGMPEGVTTLGALWGSSVAGIDKSKQRFVGADGTEYVYNFVDMAKQYYTIEGVMHNRMGGASGQTFWYEIYPQVLFARIMNLYEMDPASRSLILEGADKWVEALPNFVDKGNGRFHYTSYSFFEEKPVLGRWVEPPNGALAFLMINAYRLTGDMKYIEAAKEFLDYHEEDIRNPNYEIIQDYLPYAAAYMNFMGFGSYNVEKFVNFLFDAEDDMRPTGIVRGSMWGEFDANGLMGYDNWGNDNDHCWAFAMNTFHLASVLVPMLRYDPRFADDVGKWFLNAVNSARIFYSWSLDSDHKSDPELSGDIAKYIPYEGTSKYKRYSVAGADFWDKNISPYAMGDPTMRGWGQTDYGVYGAGHVGLFSVAKETNVEQILQIDITRMDDFKEKGDAQQYLYYNPWKEEKSVELKLPQGNWVLFDTIRNKVISKKASGTVNIAVPAQSSVIVALFKEGATYEVSGGYLVVNGIKLTRLNQASVTITSPVIPRQDYRGTLRVEMESKVYEGDAITRMLITFQGHTLYDGQPINHLDINLDSIPQDRWVMVPAARDQSGSVIRYSDYRPEGAIKVQIYTQNGCYDVSTIRIRKR